MTHFGSCDRMFTRNYCLATEIETFSLVLDVSIFRHFSVDVQLLQNVLKLYFE